MADRSTNPYTPQAQPAGPQRPTAQPIALSQASWRPTLRVAATKAADFVTTGIERPLARPGMLSGDDAEPANEEWGEEDGEFELEEEDLDETTVVETADAAGSSNEDHIKKRVEQESRTLASRTSEQTVDTSVPSEASSRETVGDTKLTTKFGRTVTKPILFSPEAARLADKQQARKHSGSKTPRSTVAGSKRGRKSQQQPVHDIVCTVCKDGRSPKHNRIVLCDSCDTPYHQMCHKPTIDDRVVEIADAEWLCCNCKEQNATSPKRPKLQTGATGEGLTEEQKTAYLNSLPHQVLVDLLLFAERHSSSLPIYPPDLKDRLLATAAGAVDSSSGSSQTGASSSSTGQYVPPEVTPIPATLPIPVVTVPPVPAPTQPQSMTTTGSPSDNVFPSQPASPPMENTPSYEDMIVMGIVQLAERDGSPTKEIYDWMKNKYSLHTKFRASSATQALQKAIKKGRILKEGTLYKLNPEYVPVKPQRRTSRKLSVSKDHTLAKGETKEESIKNDGEAARVEVVQVSPQDESTKQEPIASLLLTKEKADSKNIKGLHGHVGIVANETQDQQCHSGLVVNGNVQHLQNHSGLVANSGGVQDPQDHSGLASMRSMSISSISSDVNGRILFDSNNGTQSAEPDVQGGQTGLVNMQTELPFATDELPLVPVVHTNSPRPLPAPLHPQPAPQPTDPSAICSVNVIASPHFQQNPFMFTDDAMQTISMLQFADSSHFGNTDPRSFTFTASPTFAHQPVTNYRFVQHSTSTSGTRPQPEMRY